MAQNQGNNPRGQNDDPRQANEEGDPKVSGRVRGHVANEQEDAGRTNPDASRRAEQGKQDVTTNAPHRESGDRG
jgi:hypothetical protein